MRQAYDYWQNQPGNYLKPRWPPVLGEPRPDTPGGAELVTRKERPERHPTRNCIGNARLDRSCSTGHPIAPAEFPKRRSAAVPLGPHVHHGPRHAPLRRRKPFPDHAQKRLPVRAYPQESSWGGCHRPTAHRPHRCLLENPAGLQLTSKAERHIVQDSSPHNERQQPCPRQAARCKRAAFLRKQGMPLGNP